MGVTEHRAAIAAVLKIKVFGGVDMEDGFINKDIITMTNIEKVYKMGSSTYKALDGVTLNISKGEYAAIVGPSGAGKSTLMNIIGCLDKPTNGEYILDGLNTNCSDNKLAEIRNKKIGFIFQNYNLLPKLNVFQNIELPLLYLGYSSSKIKEKVLRAIEKVDLESHIKHKPSELTALQTPEVTIELWIKLVY